jgi:hypothetical protein
MRRPTWSDEQLRDAVARSESIRAVICRLGLVPAGGNYQTVRDAIRRLGLDTAHFRGQGWRRGTSGAVTPPRPLDEVLVAGRRTQSFGLKQRLVAAGVLPYACDECGIGEWRGRRLALELDHVNGDSGDNRIENLRLLCPNCHSQTPTYRGWNIGSSHLRVREEPGWWNGIHGGLKNLCREACGFESRPGHRGTA